jgi:hypothetical protein
MAKPSGAYRIQLDITIIFNGAENDFAIVSALDEGLRVIG